MARKALLFFFLVLTPWVAKAQDTILYRHKLKTNLALYYMRQANLAYEYRFNQHFALDAGLGLIYDGKRSAREYFYFDEIIPEWGQVIRLTLKRYETRAFYFAWMYQFKHIGFTDEPYHEGSGGSSEDAYGRMSETRNVHSISILAGRDIPLGPVILEIFFGGGYKRVYYTKDHITRIINYSDRCPCEVSYTKGGYPVVHFGIKAGYQFRPQE